MTDIYGPIVEALTDDETRRIILAFRRFEDIELRWHHPVRVRQNWKGRRFCTAPLIPDFMIVDAQIEHRVVGRWL